MENFLGSNPEILNDETGSNELPKLVTVSNGKNRGYNFVTKISTMFYKGVKSNTVKRDGSLNIRCSHHRTGCQWTGRVLNKSGISADLPEFWLNQENWAMLPKFNAHIHTCAGISKEEICDLQLRNFTKEKLDDGHLSFKSILSVSGLPNKLHDNLFNLIGDKNKYQRVCQRKRKITDKIINLFVHKFSLHFKTLLKITLFYCYLYHYFAKNSVFSKINLINNSNMSVMSAA